MHKFLTVIVALFGPLILGLEPMQIVLLFFMLSGYLLADTWGVSGLDEQS